ncbi:methylenetetrahydrofolate reductase [Zafaria sp. Z1313]|uniref:methylenetetrahydrofolate reductase n=1 Tax=unclassified Zafaria TaxID=2828765 RepID=UPI002E775C01|nr:methylenetetrahydrofolate reductase [Zafaria sp. J156]MEE1622668.1 methylenetetrahydrofolate reductase [Zafaria sp. J156]
MFQHRTEIVPSGNILDNVKGSLPSGSAVAVTCLPHHGIERTMRTALHLADEGYQAIPHLAARSVESRAQVSKILRYCETAGIEDIFVVGGDAQHPAGPYDSALPLLRDIREMAGRTIKLGVAGYPEGHPSVRPPHLLEALVAKQEIASYVVTQMCFSAPKILDFITIIRREGFELPVWAGVAGAVPRTKLVSLASKIGVGTSLKFLSRQGPLARRLLIGDSYSPATLISDLTRLPDAVTGIHLYSFNNLTPVSTPPAMLRSTPN